MSKYIELEDIKSALIELAKSKKWLGRETITSIVNALINLPTIDIVHCEDCRLATYTVENRKTNEIFYACPYSSIHNGGKIFCAYGERIDNE